MSNVDEATIRRVLSILNLGGSVPSHLLELVESCVITPAQDQPRPREAVHADPAI